MAKKERPGIIIRFDYMRSLHKMSEAAQGRFLMACLHYGYEHLYPNFEGLEAEDVIRLETLWELTQPNIDSDELGWKEGVKQRKYAGYCSGKHRNDEEPMGYEQYDKLYESGIIT